jgi:hypothetical protein
VSGSELATADDREVRHLRLDLHREWRWRSPKPHCIREIAIADRNLALLERCRGGSVATVLAKPAPLTAAR